LDNASIKKSLPDWFAIVARFLNGPLWAEAIQLITVISSGSTVNQVKTNTTQSMSTTSSTVVSNVATAKSQLPQQQKPGLKLSLSSSSGTANHKEFPNRPKVGTLQTLRAITKVCKWFGDVVASYIGACSIVVGFGCQQIGSGNSIIDRHRIAEQLRLDQVVCRYTFIYDNRFK
jgi:hypothetical protein